MGDLSKEFVSIDPEGVAKRQKLYYVYSAFSSLNLRYEGLRFSKQPCQIALGLTGSITCLFQLFPERLVSRRERGF